MEYILFSNINIVYFFPLPKVVDTQSVIFSCVLFKIFFASLHEDKPYANN